MESSYKIETNENSSIKLPKDYTTDLELEKKVVDLINSETENWTEKINRNGYKIWSKEVEGSLNVMLKGEGTIDYPVDVVFKAMTDIELGRQWNIQFYNMEEFEIKQVKNRQESKFYMVMKFPWPLAHRDFIENRYEFKHYGDDKSYLVLWTSTTHEKYPEKSSPVRGEMMMNAQYIHAIDDTHTKLYILNFADVKITYAVQGLVNRKAPGAQEEYITGLRGGCKLVN